MTLPTITIPTPIPGIGVGLGPGGAQVKTPVGNIPIPLPPIGNKPPGTAPPTGSAPQPVTTSPVARKPLNGSRVGIVLPGVDLGTSYVLMKESIANWLGLKPTAVPEYGIFGGLGHTTNPNTGPGSKAKAGNTGYPYTKTSGGYRFASFKVLLQPGVTINEPPKAGGTTAWAPRNMKTFSIGFPRGQRAGKRITVKKVCEFLKTCKQAKNIRGVITPSGRQHLWAFSNPKGGNPVTN